MDSLNAESLFVNRYHPIESLDSQYGLTEVKQRNLRNLNAAFFRRPHAEKFEADKLFDGACFEDMGARCESSRFKPSLRHRAARHMRQPYLALRAGQRKPRPDIFS